MEIVETEHFYQLKAKEERAKGFIFKTLDELGGSFALIEVTNDIDEKLVINYDNLEDAKTFLEKFYHYDICVTVFKSKGDAD